MLREPVAFVNAELVGVEKKRTLADDVSKCGWKVRHPRVARKLYNPGSDIPDRIAESRAKFYSRLEPT